MDTVPRELLLTICEMLPDSKSFKAWRLVCSDFYNVAAGWPGQTGRFANDLTRLISHFPAANWNWERLSSSDYIPFSFVETFPDLPWTKEIAKCNSNPQIHWRRFYAIRPDALIGCLRFSPDYEEFIDDAIAQYGEEKCFRALGTNNHLTRQFVADHPSDGWTDMLYYFAGTDIAMAIKFSEMIDWEYASTHMPLEDIVQHPELPWVADVVAAREPDPVVNVWSGHQRLSPLTYEYLLANIETLSIPEMVYEECRVPIEYVLRHNRDIPESLMMSLSMTVHVLEIFANPVDRQGRKIGWEDRWVAHNHFINWQLIVDHPEIAWDFSVLSCRYWDEKWY